MRGVPVRFWIVSALFLGLNLGAWVWVRQSFVSPAGTRSPSTLKVVAALPQQQIDQTDRLSVVFDAPAVSPEKVGQLEDAPLFKVTPQLAGQWKWSSSQRLDFVLDDPLPAGRVINVQPSTDLEVQLGKPVVLTSQIEFRTRALEMTACKVLSANPNEVQFELQFNQSVDPGSLLRHLKVQESLPLAAASDRSGVQPLPGDAPFADLHPACLTNQPSDRLILRCQRPERRTLDIIVAAELTGHNAERPLGIVTTRNLTLPATFAYVRTDVPTPGTEQHLTVRAFFSEELQPDQKLPPITVTPEVKDLVLHIDHQPWARAALVLQGRFQPGRNYQVHVGKTILSKDGQTLPDDAQFSFTIPDREPTVSFAQNRGILSPAGNLSLDIQTVNIGQLRCRATRIHANNLVAHLQGQDSDSLGRTVVEKTLTLSAHSEPQTQVLEIRKLLGDEQPIGIYEIEARAIDETWRRDQATVTITDLGIVAKREARSLWVWVTSLKSAQPAAGVTVTAMSYTNQTLARGVTAADGSVRLDIPAPHPDGAPWVILAEKDKDLAYLQTQRHEWVVDHVDQSGRPHPGAYDVMLYTERGVYRPGDTVHVTGIIRDAQGEIPSSFPLAIKVRRPDGRTAATQTVTPVPEQQGFFQFDFPTAEDSQTGVYELTATLPGSVEILGETTTQVEAFVPARIEVTASPAAARVGPGEKGVVTISSRYLFGQPAADLPLRVQGSYQLIPFPAKSITGYQFPIAQSNRHSVEIDDLKLDAQGQATVELPTPPATPVGLWRAVLTATVTEPGGRSISQNVAFHWDTSDRHIGLKIGQIVAVGEQTSVDFVQWSGLDTPAPAGPVQVVLERIEYDTVLRQTDGQYRWISNARYMPVETQLIAAESITEGQGRLTIKCPIPGSYRLLAIDQTSQQTTSTTFYASSQSNESSAIALNQPERLEVLLDQAKYQPGSTAKVVIKSPFAGTLLVCLESDRVIDYRVLVMTENSTTLELPVPAGLRGGAFVTAAVVREIVPEDTSWLPHRALGMARLTTDHSAHALPVQITAPAKSNPGARLQVSVQSQQPASGQTTPYVHLWAVDEGILLTTRYETPDLLNHFLGQRKLGVVSEDVFASLLPDHRRAADWSRIGGDAGGHDLDGKRRSLVPPKKIEMAVIWQGIQPLDAQGQSHFDLQLPDFKGELRLMAVVVDGDRYGVHEQPVTVTSPLHLEASWPRFVAPGDQFTVPVKLFNATDLPLPVNLQLIVDGPVRVTLPPETGHIELAPQSPVTIWLPVRAEGMGTAQVTLKATSSRPEGEVLVSQQIERLPVRPGLPLHTESVALQGTAGTPLEVALGQDFAPGTWNSVVTIHSQPEIQLLPAVDALVDYPYGCVEQTSSRLWALLAAKDILRQQVAQGGREQLIDDMIRAGIGRLWAMQTRSGGLGYWPGAEQPDAWGTVYAAEVLAAAQTQGYPVDPQFQHELSAYLTSILHGRSGEAVDLPTKAAICQVMARWQQPEEGWMTRLTEQVADLDMGGRAELAAAWNLAGRKDRAAASILPDTLDRTSPASFHGRISSPTRQTAQLLETLLELDRSHPWVPQLVNRLTEARRSGRWGNTAEDAMALRALVRYYAIPHDTVNYTGELVAGEMRHAFQHAVPAQIAIPAIGEPLQIHTTGTGSYFVNVTTTGLRKAGDPVTYDRQLEVRRAWTDAAGKPINLSQVRVGDLIHVAVSVRTLPHAETGFVQNIALVDALPGGLEVENPRLATSAQPGEQTQPSDHADHVEFLDDRVVLFGWANSEPRTFRYSLRAVAAGRFEVPPIQGSCMYSTDYASIHGGGTIEIVR